MGLDWFSRQNKISFPRIEWHAMVNLWKYWNCLGIARNSTVETLTYFLGDETVIYF